MFGVWYHQESHWCRLNNDLYKESFPGATIAVASFRIKHPAFDYSVREHRANCLGNTSKCCDGRYDITADDLKTLLEKLEI